MKVVCDHCMGTGKIKTRDSSGKPVIRRCYVCGGDGKQIIDEMEMYRKYR